MAYIKAVSIADLEEQCHAWYAIYSPSRGKLYKFSSNGESSPDITHNSLTNIGWFPDYFHNKYLAQKKLGLAYANGWTDAVVKLVYRAPAYWTGTPNTSDANNFVEAPCKIDLSSMTKDKRSFAEWLISSGNAELVTMKGDL